MNTKEYAWLTVFHHNIGYKMTHFIWVKNLMNGNCLTILSCYQASSQTFPKTWTAISESPIPPSFHLINVSIIEWRRRQTLEVDGQGLNSHSAINKPCDLGSYLTCVLQFWYLYNGKKPNRATMKLKMGQYTESTWTWAWHSRNVRYYH